MQAITRSTAITLATCCFFPTLRCNSRRSWHSLYLDCVILHLRCNQKLEHSAICTIPLAILDIFIEKYFIFRDSNLITHKLQADDYTTELSMRQHAFSRLKSISDHIYVNAASYAQNCDIIRYIIQSIQL